VFCCFFFVWWGGGGGWGVFFFFGCFFWVGGGGGGLLGDIKGGTFPLSKKKKKKKHKSKSKKHRSQKGRHSTTREERQGQLGGEHQPGTLYASDSREIGEGRMSGSPPQKDLLTDTQYIKR